MRRLVSLGIVLALLVGFVGLRKWSEGAVARELQERVSRSDEPAKLGFSYEVHGSRVADCFLPNRRFVGSVDYGSGSFDIQTASEQQAVVLVRNNRVFIHSTLLREGTLGAEWLRVEGADVDDAAPLLRRALGGDLAAYVLAGALPPSGRETVLELLRVAERVERLPAQEISGRSADRFSVRVDAERFDDAVADEARPAPSTTEPVASPVAEVWLRGDVVVRIAIRPDGSGDAEEAPEHDAGWTIDYGRAVPLAPTPAPAASVPFASVANPDLARPIARCELPVG